MFPKTSAEDEVPQGAAVCAHYVRCGKQSCRCAKGGLHGPYYRYGWRENGRQRWRYVHKAGTAEALREYELARELSRLNRPKRQREKSFYDLIFPKPGRGANLRARHALRRR
jgi:hypothetical protein